METMVFICTGNTCRSPMAEGFYRELNGESRLGMQAKSAGVYTTDGMPASDNAILAAKEKGADITMHHSRQLNESIVQKAKYIVCMTAAQADRLCEVFPQHTDKIFTLDTVDISDPFGGDLGVYRSTAAELYDSVGRLIERLEKQG